MKDLRNFRVYDAPDVNLRNTGMILKQLRLKNNLSVRDLQEFFGFDYPNAIYDWEKGLKLPNLSNLIALSTLYEVSIDEILLSDEQDFHFREPLLLNCEIITKNYVLLLCVQCSIMFTNNYGGNFMKTANVYARIEPEIKDKAEDILKKIGIPASVAINMYYKQIIVSNGIPFKVTADAPKQINLDLMTKDEFDLDMERRYQEALKEEGIEANTYFKNFKKRNKVNA